MFPNSSRFIGASLSALLGATILSNSGCAAGAGGPNCVERSGDVCITEQDTRAAYERYARLQQGKTEYEVRHILVDTQAKAQAALVRLHAGETFASVAHDVSQDVTSGMNGGELGWNQPANFVPEFSNEMIALAPTGVSTAPVKTQFGWHIVEVTGTRPVMVKPYELMRAEIAFRLMQARTSRPQGT